MSALIPLRAYLFRYKAALLGGFLFILAANIVALVLPYLIRLAVDSLWAGVNSGLLLRYGLLIVVVGLLQGALQFFGRFFPSKASRQIEDELRANLFKHLEKLELNYFQNTPGGSICRVQSGCQHTFRV
jgi:ABC-type multidrug transport system fused ATPase/permease subunit